ncbi:hypothetical protein GF386_05230 [Candidatus Pacearchaeota archaeon]|nr:hypothetical protein [Candidatus Pacearchaeota archaeon]MBD3283512.1 hypothetical protein [Candidatus Pacearchaeota archaeon]
MGVGKSLKRKLAEGRGTPHRNKYQGESHAEEYFQEVVERANNARRKKREESPVRVFGMWWRYNTETGYILFLNKKKRDDEDGFSHSEVMEIAPQIQEPCIESYCSDRTQHFLVRCKKREFYVEINSMGDVRLPCSVDYAQNRDYRYVRTNDPDKIQSFSTMQDWKPEDFRDSRRHFLVSD